MNNKSFTYLMPLYCKYLRDENPDLKDIIFLDYLKECYIYHKVNDTNKDCFILKFEKPTEKDEIFQKMLFNLKKCSIFAEQLSENNSCYIKLITPNIIEDARNKFIKGHFSIINQKDKIIILKFLKEHISTAFSTEINFIFSKNKYRREELEKQLGITIPKDLELSSIPDQLSETF